MNMQLGREGPITNAEVAVPLHVYTYACIHLQFHLRCKMSESEAA